MSNLYNEYANLALQQMRSLYNFIEEHNEIINRSDRYSELTFNGERGYSLQYIAVDNMGNLYALFSVYGWESTSTFALDLTTGYNTQMAKLKSIVTEEEYE